MTVHVLHSEARGPRLGVSYYPDQWPRSRWRPDAALMADAGLSLVRIGEFAWAMLEPEPGRFEFDWLDDAIEILAEAGLDVVLGTPTAAPPVWLSDRHPEIHAVLANGRTAPFGHRRHYCPNQPAFHDATERIVAALAERYGRDTRIVAWQIDNELGGRCFCERCREAFQDWLRDRYGSLDNLNESWGTAFWSQIYSSWRQIPLPEGAPVPPEGFLPYAPNPGLALDYRRFAAESFVRYQGLQIRILRERCAPEQRITHNVMSLDNREIDHRALAEELDFVSWSNYPLLAGSWWRSGMSADAMRMLKENGRVWVLEQQVGPLGWELLRTPRRGQLRLLTYQAMAHGAEAIVYFRWRTARYGTEQHWHGLLDHDGRTGRRFREVQKLAGELERLRGPLAGGRPAADAALLYDADSRFALQIQPTNLALGYEETERRHYEALRRLGLGIDVVSPGADLSSYPLVVAPNLYVIDPALAHALADYVEQGGWLVLAPRCGFKDRCNAVPDRPLPAWLDELAGLTVIDYASVSESETAHVAGTDFTGEFAGWYEELELKDAEALAGYTDGEFAGTPAVAEHRVGRGLVTYVAGAAGEPTLRALYRELCPRRALTVAELPDGVEIVRIEGTPNGPLLFLLNHAAEERTVEMDGEWLDLIAETSGSGEVPLPAHGVALISTAVVARRPRALREEAPVR
jgi:beta-galactosidase